MTNNANQLNLLVDLMKKRWGDNAPEAFAGLLSTLINDNQLNKLIEHLQNKEDK